jgi:hypothetical protein
MLRAERPTASMHLLTAEWIVELESRWCTVRCKPQFNNLTHRETRVSEVEYDNDEWGDGLSLHLAYPCYIYLVLGPHRK